ncbi:MAG: methylenetetrahydrofolate--tRNA-(uracil(54)-C(5))-methyltransferase (FADH(2)-oxidizing) TrmFO [Eubacteriales bacterium]|nr:methylenetetrahydrofolate--tRNA-(uracil(54)-C(5))-methyltransferase (FADH(2)-oxidizing) TrmFO [Eubacteriales bacterium]
MIDLRVVGAGLAGSEAALQLTRFGLKVELIDMKPGQRSPAHTMNDLAELVCSNSLKSEQETTASGLLKLELRELGSELLRIAETVRVPAGSALAVDRELFAEKVTAEIRNNPLITFRTEEIKELPQDDVPTIIATGPLTTDSLYKDIERFTGEDNLHFFDAIAPIVDAESLDPDQYFRAARYGKGGDDYINCPLIKEEYLQFRNALVEAKCAPVKDYDDILFADCQPIEELARRGEDAMRYGPLRPKGLRDPRSGETPYAVLQLRQENLEGTMYSLVGCQTRLTFGEQKRVFTLIPALADAEFLRYGVMHRNTYINAPTVLNLGFSTKKNPRLFFAGQISGVEGYVESIAAGLMAAHQAAAYFLGCDQQKALSLLPSENTVSGALARYIVQTDAKKFQPMNANFGLLPLPAEVRIKKAERGAYRRDRSLESIRDTARAVNDMAREGRYCRTTSAYYYDLPEELIAEEPSKQRDHSRLIVFPRGEDIIHSHFYDLPRFLQAGDLLVMNDTRVLPARLFGERIATGAKIECLLIRQTDSEGPVWDVLAKPARRCQTGDRIVFSAGELEAEVIKEMPNGGRRLRFICSEPFEQLIDRLGVVPLPPYIHKDLKDPERYQTVYATHRGSVAAPTAGLHFTPELLEELREMGVEISKLTLHVGIGTFRPVKTDSINEHHMHSEQYYFSQETAEAIMAAKKRGGRVIAVGTTSLRVLESVALNQSYPGKRTLQAESGETDIFIYPGYRFRLIDGLITNFHLPESTLLMLVSALMGREEILGVYEEAIARDYRFFSFGDAMLLLPQGLPPDTQTREDE